MGECEIVIMGRVQVLLLFSVFFLASGERGERKKEGLKWFPASKEEDCGEVPDPVQIREGKPSNTCKKAEERFCLCGRVGKGTKASWRFLCGTCKITFSFKLDSVESAKQE